MDGHLGQSAAVIQSILYLVLRRLLGLFRSSERTVAEADLEIVVLRHQVAILRRQVKGDRCTGGRTGRSWPRRAGSSPERRGARSWSGRRRSFDGTGSWSQGSGPSRTGGPGGRPSTRRPGTWSCGWLERTRGGGTAGSRASSSAWASTSRRPRSPRSFAEPGFIRRLGWDRPGPSSSTPRPPGSWPATSSPSRPFFLKTYYVLFFIELKTRRVHVAGATTNPDSAWVTQQARNVSGDLQEPGVVPRFLIHDRDTKFTASFDVVFEADGARIITTPIRAPNANAHAERWVGTVRAECLDWILVRGRRHLERVLGEYVMHYNDHRPHRAMGLLPPESRRWAEPGYTTSKHDPKTPDSRRTHQRVRRSGVMIEFLHPTPRVGTCRRSGSRPPNASSRWPTTPWVRSGSAPAIRTRRPSVWHS